MGHCSKFASLGPLLIRLALGSIFIAHGGQKVLGLWGGGGLQATVEGFVQMGSPEWVGYAISFGELLGGLGILVGCLTRVAGLGIAAIMGGAIYLVHWPNGFFLNHYLVPDKGHGMEYAIALLAMALSLVFTGAGPLCLDCILFRKKGASQSSPEAGNYPQ